MIIVNNQPHAPFDSIKLKAYLLTIKETAEELLYVIDNDKDFPVSQDIASIDSIIHSAVKVKEGIKPVTKK